MAAHQLRTRQWWDERRDRYELFTSLVVWTEAAKGEPAMAKRRLAILEQLNLLPVTPASVDLAESLMKGLLPPKAAADAAHLALTVGHGLPCILTWNCTHLANGDLIPHLFRRIVAAGYNTLVICTPEELLGGSI